MTSLLMLISLFTQLTPSNLLAISSVSAPWDTVHYSVAFDSIDYLDEGTPVLSSGIKIGMVEAVEQMDGENGQDRAVVSISIYSPYAHLINSKSVALSSTPVVSLKGDAPRPVLEVLSESDTASSPLLAGASIKGFSSFDEFWSADSIY